MASLTQWNRIICIMIVFLSIDGAYALRWAAKYQDLNLSHGSDAWPSTLRPPTLIAVLRGVKLKHLMGVTRILVDEGFTMLSVTADTPRCFEIVDALANISGIVPGMSSVLTTEQVEKAASHGARFISSTTFDPAVVHCTKELNLLSIPGVLNAAEATEAIAAGGDILKIFPAHKVPPSALQELVGSLPAGTKVIIAGGLTVDRIQAYTSAGAMGFAAGSTLFKAGVSIPDLRERARAFYEEGIRCHGIVHAAKG